MIFLYFQPVGLLRGLLDLRQGSLTRLGDPALSSLLFYQVLTPKLIYYIITSQQNPPHFPNSPQSQTFPIFPYFSSQFLCRSQQIKQMIYFIRHAQSKYNAAEKQIQTRNGQNYLDCQEYLAAKFDSRFFDVEITERGVEQSLAARKEVAELDVDIILVSPLRRALQTCSVIFEGHKSKAQIVVEPAFREIMESSNDIGTEVDESMGKFPTFDFSHIKDKQAWYVHTLHDESDRQDILSKLQGKEGHARKQKCIELCLSFMKQNWSARRSQPQKEEFYKQKILPSYPIQKQIICEYLKKYQKIAIVAHSECIKRYAGYKINNCQVFKVQGSSI